MPADQLPVAVVGAGPIGLTTALGLAHHGVPFVLLEEDAELSVDSKAGTILTRTLEIWDRYGCVDEVLAAGLRIDEIADIDRASNTVRSSIQLGALRDDTRFPFVLHVPQHQLEPILAAALGGPLLRRHRLDSFEIKQDRVVLFVETPEGRRELEASHLLACDGGRSRVRDQLGATLLGETLPERYMLVDVVVDVVVSPRDYPGLAYFADPDEWLVLIRLPDCWRFVFPWSGGPLDVEEKVRRFVGDADSFQIRDSASYSVHHRVADQWSSQRRVFLLGDAAHLITPMWALGLNTGALDASNLPWRLAWVRRGWADPALLDGYQREQRPIAVEGSGEMAEAARRYMSYQRGAVTTAASNWAAAYTRSLLGVRLDTEATGDWSMVMNSATPPPIRPGDRAPNLPLHGPHGRVWIHDLIRDAFAAFYFMDVRRQHALPGDSPALRHVPVSRWDGPGGYFDPGGLVRRRYGVPEESLVLVRPDGHVAAVEPIRPGAAEAQYTAVTGRPVP